MPMLADRTMVIIDDDGLLPPSAGAVRPATRVPGCRGQRQDREALSRRAVQNSGRLIDRNQVAARADRRR